MNEAAANPPAPPSRGSLLVIFLTVFIDLLGFGMVLPLLPLYAKTFGVDKHGWELGLLMASFSAMTFLFAPLWGKLSDRIGRRPVIIVGLAGFGCVLRAVWRGGDVRRADRPGLAVRGADRRGHRGGNDPDGPGLHRRRDDARATRTKGMALIGAAFGLGFTFGPLIGYAALWFSRRANPTSRTSPWPGFAAAALSGLAFLLALALLPESLRPGKRTEHHFVLRSGKAGPTR